MRAQRHQMEIVMTKLIYGIVEHDGGWAYKLGAVFSETFPTWDAALKAAKSAAAEQQVAGQTDGIEYQDAQGKWHEEVSQGDDRPRGRSFPPIARLRNCRGRQPDGSQTILIGQPINVDCKPFESVNGGGNPGQWGAAEAAREARLR
jgi:hypothetical protein